MTFMIKSPPQLKVRLKKALPKHSSFEQCTKIYSKLFATLKSFLAVLNSNADHATVDLSYHAIPMKLTRVNSTEVRQ